MATKKQHKKRRIKIYAHTFFHSQNENESIIVREGPKMRHFASLGCPFHFWTFLKMSNFEKTF
jgi:hypothetical protein